MKTTQNCLQEMVNAIKGVEPNEVAENKTTQTLLREIADAINNETTTDEGKNTQTLLGDITEAIRESGGGSGGETFEVTITAGDSITADKTYSEIMTAINADSKVAFTIIERGESQASLGYYVWINSQDTSEKIIMVSFTSWRAVGKIGTLFFGINSNNEIQQIEMNEAGEP